VPSIGDVATEVRAALKHVASIRAILADTLNSLEAAGRAYAAIGEGSTQPDLSHAAAYLEHAYDQIRGAIAILDRATNHARSYLATIAGTALPTEQLESLRQQLPEPIPASRTRGRKTHGRWIGPDGRVRRVVSGEDTQSLAARARLRSFGYPRLAVESHAEMKVAEYLRQVFETTKQPQQATIVLNNRVCAGALSCEELLPVILPAGCSLTVYAPGCHRTFLGGTTP
jgi:hypothetical protein